MSTQLLPLWLFAAVGGTIAAVILLKVGKLRGSPRLAFVAEQVVAFEQGGAYALWLTSGERGFWMRVLTEARPRIALIDPSGGEIEIVYPALPLLIRGFGSYRRLALFAIENPGRYSLRISGPATRRPGAATARLILERRRT